MHVKSSQYRKGRKKKDERRKKEKSSERGKEKVLNSVFLTLDHPNLIALQMIKIHIPPIRDGDSCLPSYQRSPIRQSPHYSKDYFSWGVVLCVRLKASRRDTNPSESPSRFIICSQVLRTPEASPRSTISLHHLPGLHPQVKTGSYLTWGS